MKRSHPTRHPDAVVAQGVEVIVGDAREGRRSLRDLGAADFERALDLLAEGRSIVWVARELGCSPRAFQEWLHHPSRLARVRDARAQGAEAVVQRLNDLLEGAPPQGPMDAFRTRELAHHYRWLARVLAPKVYGDRVEVTHRAASLAEALQALEAPGEQPVDQRD